MAITLSMYEWDQKQNCSYSTHQFCHAQNSFMSVRKKFGNNSIIDIAQRNRSIMFHWFRLVPPKDYSYLSFATSLWNIGEIKKKYLTNRNNLSPNSDKKHNKTQN